MLAQKSRKLNFLLLSGIVKQTLTVCFTGPPEILAKLADPELADTVDPNSYKFRIFIEMETGDERYRDRLNCGMWIGSGMRKGLEVIYE